MIILRLFISSPVNWLTGKKLLPAVTGKKKFTSNKIKCLFSPIFAYISLEMQVFSREFIVAVYKKPIKGCVFARTLIFVLGGA